MVHDTLTNFIHILLTKHTMIYILLTKYTMTYMYIPLQTTYTRGKKFSVKIKCK